MRNINKLICLAIFPAVAFTTSCSGYGKKVSFTDAYQHAFNNYDKHQLDKVDTDYSANMHTFTLTGHSDTINNEGKTTHPYNHNFGGLNFDIKNLFGICITTEALGYIQYFYSTYAGATIGSLTGIKLDLSYYIKSGNMSIVLSTKSIENITYLLQGIYSIIQIPMIKQMIIAKIPIPAIQRLLNIVTFSADSKATGSLEIAATTDSCGFLKSASIKTRVDYDLGFGFATSEKIPTLKSYVNTVGTLDFNLSVNASFKN